MAQRPFPSDGRCRRARHQQRPHQLLGRRQQVGQSLLLVDALTERARCASAGTEEVECVGVGVPALRPLPPAAPGVRWWRPPARRAPSASRGGRARPRSGSAPASARDRRPVRGSTSRACSAVSAREEERGPRACSTRQKSGVRRVGEHRGGEHPRDQLSPSVGQRAHQQDGRCVDVTADREHLVAAQRIQRAVAGPVQHRVQRSEVVRLGPGGAVDALALRAVRSWALPTCGVVASFSRSSTRPC